MCNFAVVVLILAGFAPDLFAADPAHVRRLQAAEAVFSEVMSASDKAIPQSLLDKSRCVIIVPGLKKGAFFFGARFGRGFVTCRRKEGPGWIAPGAVRIEGGSFGLQVGGKETDVILLVMNERGVERLLTSQFTLGGQASVAAGPVGRTAAAETDALMTAEILSWSRSRGVFAGVSIQGATLRQDLGVNRSLYGRTLENKEILQSPPAPPSAAEGLIATLNKYSSR
jgi:lipid-binding SYLF domain-containing protein